MQNFRPYLVSIYINIHYLVVARGNPSFHKRMCVGEPKMHNFSPFYVNMYTYVVVRGQCPLA